MQYGAAFRNVSTGGKGRSTEEAELITSLLLLALAAAPAQSPTGRPGAPPAAADSLQEVARTDSLERVARAAGRRYEYLLRRLIPSRPDYGAGGDCDEIIGRFCFTFDDPTEEVAPPPPAEDPGIGEARLVAVRTYRRWFSVEPEDPEAAGMVVRYLIEEGRAREALAAARTHAWAAGRDAPSLLLVGLALHYAAEFDRAEAVFDSARAAIGPEERRRLDDIGVLLDDDERDHYEALSSRDRAAYERRFWALADPSALQPGNERRSGHYARHAWIGILSEAPRVAGMISWGEDHEEILLRYGRPVSRERVRPSHVSAMLHQGVSLVETFDPLAVRLVEPALVTEGVPEQEGPDPARRLEGDSARSAYSPVLLRRLRSLTVQQNRFPTPSGIALRVDAALPPDTAEPRVPARPRGLLVVLDTAGDEVARVETPVHLDDDSAARFTAEVVLPPGHYVYRAEIVDTDSTGLGGLARYGVRLVPPLGLTLSDLLVTRPWGDSLPRSRDELGDAPPLPLVFPTGAAMGIYAEVSGLAPAPDRRRYGVEWWIERADPEPLLARAFGWLGRTLGLVEEREPPRVRWEDAAEAGRAAIAFNLDLGEAEPGLYRLSLRLTDRVSGESRTRTRLVRVATGPVDGSGRARD